jgi:hypothetical protein
MRPKSQCDKQTKCIQLHSILSSSLRGQTLATDDAKLMR